MSRIRLTDWDGARSQLQTIRDERRRVEPLLDDLVLTAERRAQQADYLRSIGCQFAQGYFFARPGRREDFEAMVRAWGAAA